MTSNFSSDHSTDDIERRVALSHMTRQDGTDLLRS